MNELSLIVNNREYSGWTSVTYKRSMENLCSEFSVSITDRFTPIQKPFFIFEQDSVELRIDGQKLLSGYVDEVNPDYSAGGGTTITVNGRNKTADLVDCSALYRAGKGTFKTKFENIINALIAPFNVSAVLPADLPTDIFKFSVESGDTVFQALDRIASRYGLLLQSDSEGRLIFLKNEFTRAETGLAVGDNIKRIGASYNVTDRFSTYTVRGQNATDGAGGWKKSQPQITAQASDGGIIRNRPLLLQAETNASAATCQKRAQWEATVRRARAVRSNVEVQGWYQTDSKKLWEINKIVNVNAPQVYIENVDLLISSVEFVKNNSGTITNLELVPKDSYLPEPPKEQKRRGGNKKRWL